MLNLATIVEVSAREFPDRTAMIADDVTLTHADLNTVCSVAATVA